jgi:hypothetical protein
MDEREPPGINPPKAATTRRFPRLMTPPTVRRLSPSRLALAGLGAACALVLVWLVVAQVWRAARGYVDRQPAYLLSYRDIVLDPAPPAWFRGGPEAFLEHALSGAGEFQTFSALNFDQAQLLLLFRRYAWVEKGLRVEVADRNRVVVRLDYREPVAVERMADATERTVVDHDGVILPRSEIDFDRVGPLVLLYGFSPPVDPRPGLSWSRVEAEHGFVGPDEQVRNAARLAAFLRNELRRETIKDPNFRLVVIHRWGLDGYAVQVGAKLVFKWDEPGSGDAAGRLSDEAKWAMLLDRVRRVPPKEGDPWVELKFTKDGVEVDDVHNAPHQAGQHDSRVPLRRTKRTQAPGRERDAAG